MFSTLDICLRMLLIRPTLMALPRLLLMASTKMADPGRQKNVSFRGPLTPRGFRKVSDN